MITNDARCTCDFKSTIAMAKAAFDKKKDSFTSKLDLNLRAKLVKCYIWSITLLGAENWTLCKVDKKGLKRSEIWCWRRMEKISWTDLLKNEQHYIQSSGRGISCVVSKNCLLKHVIEGKIGCDISDGKTRKKT